MRTCAIAWMVILIAQIVGVESASAQNWCYDWCYPTTACEEPCYDGYWTTCAEWGSCDYHYCVYSSVCNSSVDCNTECYTGEYPYGSWTTCGAAQEDCFACEPTYVQGWETVGQYVVVSGDPYYGYTATGYKTEQLITRDTSCGYGPVTYGDCRAIQMTPPRYSSDPCDEMPGGCFGEVWPASCTN